MDRTLNNILYETSEYEDYEAFVNAKDKIIGKAHNNKGIGTLSEKTLHAVLKLYYEPDEDKHEVAMSGYYADIYNDKGIIEIQTRQLNKLRDKLSVFLQDYHVTVVYPLPFNKWLSWVNPDNGEVQGRRKSPRHFTEYDAFYELYKIKSYLRHPGSMILMFLVMLATFTTFALLLFLIFYILINGIPYIKPSLFSLHYTSDNASVIPALINTVVMTLLSLLIAVPFGIFSAIFLVEYAGKGNKFIEVIRLTTETLSGIPSIVYGLFGMLFFVNTLKWGFSVLAGAFTLSIMILPLIMRQTEEALKAVPDSYREGSFGLGAGKLRTVFRIVLPSAVPGILAGVILAIGRIVGETAALIYTAGTVAQVPKNVLGSGRTLAIHMYMLSSEGLYMNQAYATAVILLVLVVAINTLSGVVAKKLTKA